jgi:hypothetical protein
MRISAKSTFGLTLDKKEGQERRPIRKAGVFEAHCILMRISDSREGQECGICIFLGIGEVLKLENSVRSKRGHTYNSCPVLLSITSLMFICSKNHSVCIYTNIIYVVSPITYPYLAAECSLSSLHGVRRHLQASSCHLYHGSTVISVNDNASG